MIDALVASQWIVAGAVALPLLLFSLEVLFGIPAAKPLESGTGNPSTCILIPAHNEEMIIAKTLALLRPILPINAYILVVADNCDDATAKIVRDNDLEVIERFNLEQRGKGFALDYAREWLSNSPPECVIVFDADCTTDAKSLTDLICLSVTRMSALQAGYVFEATHSVSTNVQISNFAFWIKNIIRQRGACHLGGMAILTGTGMAFPWKIFADLPLATASIVEDLALTIFLAHSGKAPVFLNQARVGSFAASEDATLQQRSRWEHGFLGVAKEHGMATLFAGIRLMDRKLILLGFHLLVPPLALLLSATMLTVIGLTGLAIFVDYWPPVLMVVTFFGLAVGTILLAWLSGGHKWLNFKSLVLLPMYLVWKLPIYLAFAIGKTATWVRTDREVN